MSKPESSSEENCVPHRGQRERGADKSQPLSKAEKLLGQTVGQVKGRRRPDGMENAGGHEGKGPPENQAVRIGERGNNCRIGHRPGSRWRPEGKHGVIRTKEESHGPNTIRQKGKVGEGGTGKKKREPR